MIVINDLHLGAIRSAGTTPASALAMRQWQLSQFNTMLDSINEDLTILGDLFDTGSVPLVDFGATYMALSDWLRHKGHKLVLVPGNHDLNNDSSKLSSFQLLGKLLVRAYPHECTYHVGGGYIGPSIYTISHVLNQDLLNLELSKVPECDYLLVHANYDNNFAKESDHSLNISKEQVDALPVRKIFFAHEHGYRVAQNGKVFVAGNQFPASVSDCLYREDKFMHRLGTSDIDRIKTWDFATGYAEMDWQEVQDTDAQFVRVKGTCTPEQAAAMANIIARYRKESDAFVVANAVNVQSPSETGELDLPSLETIRSFDLMGAVRKLLTERQIEIIEGLS